MLCCFSGIPVKETPKVNFTNWKVIAIITFTSEKSLTATVYSVIHVSCKASLSDITNATNTRITA